MYYGNEPYIFISYSSKDIDKVNPFVQALESRGFRVWYDKGLGGGEPIFEVLAEKILTCGVLISFMTNNVPDSKFCKKELQYAINKDIDVIICHMEKVTMTPGMELLLEDMEGIMSYAFDDEDEFYDCLVHTRKLQRCKEEPVSADTLYPQPAPTTAKIPEAPAAEEEKEEPKDNANSDEAISTAELVKRISEVLPSFAEEEKSSGVTETELPDSNDKAEEESAEEAPVEEESPAEEASAEETAPATEEQATEETAPVTEEKPAEEKAPDADLASRLSALLAVGKKSEEAPAEEAKEEPQEEAAQVAEVQDDAPVAPEDVQEAPAPSGDRKKEEAPAEDSKKATPAEPDNSALLSRLSELLTADKDKSSK